MAMSDEDKDWKAQSDLRTISEACKIRKDKERWKAVVSEAKKQREALDELGEELDNSSYGKYKSGKDKE